MKLKALFHWFSERVRNYNLFIPKRVVHDDDNNEAEDPATALKRQKQATWLYVLLLTRKLHTSFSLLEYISMV